MEIKKKKTLIIALKISWNNGFVSVTSPFQGTCVLEPQIIQLYKIHYVVSSIEFQ